MMHDRTVLVGNNTAVSILLVEDNVLNQIVASKMLKQWGAAVTIANHGKEALKLIQRKCFSLVLMDIQMPEMDGCETTSHIRSLEDPYFKNVPIIAFTASTLADTKEKAEKLGMNDTLPKPFHPEEMLRKINQYIMESSSPEQRPLHVNFDLYDESDVAFKLELIELMTLNLQELKEAAHEAYQAGNGIVFDRTIHKVKATVTLLNDPEFSNCIDDFAEALKEINAAAEKKLHTFLRLVQNILHSLERESQLLKSS